MSAATLPNLISIFRLILVPPLVVLVLQGRYTMALALFLVAGVSDGVDGFLARYYGWHSRLGKILDPAADKALMVATYVAFGWNGVLPVWLVGLVIGRDLVIVAGFSAYRLLFGHVEVRPMLVSKLNTLLQLVLAVVVLFDRGAAPLPDWLLASLVALTAATTVVSGIAYVVQWSRRALAEQRGGMG